MDIYISAQNNQIEPENESDFPSEFEDLDEDGQQYVTAMMKHIVNNLNVSSTTVLSYFRSGIQENDAFKREVGKQKLQQNLMQIFEPVFGIKLYDPVAFYDDAFNYYCSRQYLQHEKVPVEFEEFMQIAQPLFEACPQLSVHDFCALSTEDEAQQRRKHTLLHRSNELARAIEEAYGDDSTIFHKTADISSLHCKLMQKWNWEDQVLEAAFGNLENAWISDPVEEMPVFKYHFYDNKLVITIGNSVSHFDVDLPNFYLDGQKINMRNWMQECRDKYYKFMEQRNQILAAFANNDALKLLHIRHIDDKTMAVYYRDMQEHLLWDNKGIYYTDGSHVNFEKLYESLTSKYQYLIYHEQSIKRSFMEQGITFEDFYTHNVKSNQIDIHYHTVMKSVWFENDQLHRNQEKETVTAHALITEMVEEWRKIEEHQNEALIRSKQLFLSVLSGSEQEEFTKHGNVILKGKEFDYVILSNMSHNNIIKMPKGSKNLKQAEALCIVAKKAFIPRYDVLSTVALMIKAGNENMVNAVANKFKLDQSHHVALRPILGV